MKTEFQSRQNNNSMHLIKSINFQMIIINLNCWKVPTKDILRWKWNHENMICSGGFGVCLYMEWWWMFKLQEFVRFLKNCTTLMQWKKKSSESRYNEQKSLNGNYMKMIVMKHLKYPNAYNFRFWIAAISSAVASLSVSPSFLRS